MMSGTRYTAIFITLLATACSTKISNFEKYQKAPFLETEFMPSKEAMVSSTPNVVILDFKNEAENADKIGAGQIVQNTIAQTLTKEKLANILSRNKNDDTKNELAIAEKSGKNLSLPEFANYIISGSISSATFSGSKESTVAMVVGSRGMMDAAPGTVVMYTSEVSGILKIDEVPSLNNALTLDLKGAYTSSEDQKAGLAALAGQIMDDTKNIKTFDGTIIKKATESAINSSMMDFKNFFARSGYILEKCSYKKKRPIFKISIGTSLGIAQNQTVKIMQIQTERNDITGDEQQQKVILCTGTIADQNTSLTAWIVVKDESCIDKIRLGDIVKIVYTRSFF